jgi:hypothetical protein
MTLDAHIRRAVRLQRTWDKDPLNIDLGRKAMTAFRELPASGRHQVLAILYPNLPTGIKANRGPGPAHTAGPWFISRSENPDVYRGEEHWMIVDEPTHTCVADIETKLDAEANARLIAAAPELLEALQTIARGYGEGGKFTQEALQEIAGTAIAKADGKKAPA